MAKDCGRAIAGMLVLRCSAPGLDRRSDYGYGGGLSDQTMDRQLVWCPSESNVMRNRSKVNQKCREINAGYLRPCLMKRSQCKCFLWKDGPGSRN